MVIVFSSAGEMAEKRMSRRKVQQGHGAVRFIFSSFDGHSWASKRYVPGPDTRRQEDVRQKKKAPVRMP
jgi:hypothetical protein